MGVEIRVCAPEEAELFGRTITASFGEELGAGEVERYAHVVDPERDLGAYEGGEMVGTASAFPFELTIPGGSLPAPGVTAVGVLPSHRRQGILTQLMRHQLDDIHARGEPLAVLWASEGSIYGRFGYGLAALNGRIDCARDRMRFREPAPQEGRTRLLGLDEALTALPDVYDRVRVETPGFFSRSPEWWRWIRLEDPEHERGGGGPLFRAALELDGRWEAYALYRVHQAEHHGLPGSRLEVLEEVSTSTAATREIWRFLLGVDLMERVTASVLPIDHPLLLLVTEPARIALAIEDGLWLRLVDVEAALAARAYAAPSSLVLELADAFCPWNEGRFRLDAGAGGVQVARVNRKPDLRLDVADLGSAFLGGFSFSRLARAGRVEELRSGALQRADDLFHTGRAPWCASTF